MTSYKKSILVYATLNLLSTTLLIIETNRSFGSIAFYLFLSLIYLVVVVASFFHRENILTSEIRKYKSANEVLSNAMSKANKTIMDLLTERQS